ncbi:unnamed protein product [Ostreobium quekettii]|uniref:ABC1 atypical kinase-like domain-containing protein n=1 Tax=Ostreobium quekettii TaxID=121088 RepID=A0A8S1IR66_9CHLO|nr:unnamed protein product [Ostreobium quekettii]|eukprot:evm.model.scf_907.1 EVM.evm.TU.scf_907.1   scf_907:6402-11019(+)
MGAAASPEPLFRNGSRAGYAPSTSPGLASTSQSDFIGMVSPPASQPGTSIGPKPTQPLTPESTIPQRTLDSASRERKVPATPLQRIMGFGSLGASLAFGAMKDSMSRTLGGSVREANERDTQMVGAFISGDNAEILAAGLCRMRGAALKLGQMLSLQDENLVPPALQTALERVRAGADYMPRTQLEQVLQEDLGTGWQDRLAEFDFMPMAAASIGQVHRGVLHDGRPVAMKVQYPGVAQSIASDLQNLMMLLKVTNMLPAGLFVDNAATVMERELALECDYTNEMRSQARFRDLVEGDETCCAHFQVPAIVPELCSTRVLTSEWVPGVAIDKVHEMPSEVRNRVGSRLLYITLRELFTWRFMQTDPNWGNFLYDSETDMLSLIDFGAARDYPKTFVDNYLRMVQACAERDREKVLHWSQELGFLTGDESRAMQDAHCEAAFIVGLPFGAEGTYDFGGHSQLTPRVAELGAKMLKDRLCPPPDEAYSLHRKLSGAFLCCIKLRAEVPARALFLEVLNSHKFG